MIKSTLPALDDFINPGEGVPWSRKTLVQRINAARKQLRTVFDNLEKVEQSQYIEGRRAQIAADDAMLNSFLERPSIEMSKRSN